MVNFLRFGVGIISWACLLQFSALASELPNIKKKARFLPDSLRQTQQQNFVFTTGSESPYYLIAQERKGGSQKFEIPMEEDFQPSIPVDQVEVIEVIADRQEYDQERGIITAEGNVTMRFAQSVMTSDRLEINLNDRLAVARDNVVLKRGEQVLRGERFEYYLVADRGVIYNAGGEVYQPSLNQDTDFDQDITSQQTRLDRVLSDRLTENQPVTGVTAEEGIGATIGSQGIGLIDGQSADGGGTINRLRFEAERVDFEATTWTAKNLRLTNDPFSPPELEVRAETATFEQLDSLTGKLTTEKSRLVLDDRFKIPLLVNSFVFDSRPSEPGLFTIAFDGDERGGLFIEKTWNILERSNFSWEISPQYFLQRALIPTTFDFSDSDEGGIFNPDVFGIDTSLNATFTPRTDLKATASLPGLDLDEIEDNLRTSISVQQKIGNLNNPYRLAAEYNFRDRLFNGSLGFQTVRSSVGGVFTSPTIALGKTGVTLRYQGSIQNITAETDVPELLAGNEDDLINLTRYQAAAFLNKSFAIWRGEPLPSTKEQGLRYTPVPTVPYLNLFTGISGVSSLYSNSDSQLSLEGTIGIQGQLGHFSRSWLDYTGYKLSYSQNIRGDESPFLFDRLVDRQILSFGITQQIYGPFRFGYQTSLDLEDNDTISTDFLLEYSRRTHNIVLRYNPELKIGSFSLRISDFNWQGNSRPFKGKGIKPVIQGVNGT